MIAYIKQLFNSILSAIKPDPRPDPEDPAAYSFVDELQKEFAAKEEYYQILKNGGKPSDVVVAVPSTIKDKAPIGYTWWVDVYDGPKGKGYQMCFEITKDKSTYRKVVNCGPEEWREQDWTEAKWLTIR